MHVFGVALTLNSQDELSNRLVEYVKLVIADATGLHSAVFAELPGTRLAQCVFEMVYFARPDSTVFGKNVHQARVEYGMRLAEEHPAEADMVIPVPDSGSSAALGFSRRSGIPLDYGFIRNHYIGRTFIMPEASTRRSSVDLKISILPDVVRGKRVVVVDDSIVRGNTARNRVSGLRAAGAREVHLRVSCPPHRFGCYFGIDFPEREALLANKVPLRDLCRSLRLDSLSFLSQTGMLSCVRTRKPEDFCCACFDGEYPVLPDELDKRL